MKPKDIILRFNAVPHFPQHFWRFAWPLFDCPPLLLHVLDLLSVYHSATLFPLWDASPSLYSHTISAHLVSSLVLLLVPCFLLHDTLNFHIFHKLGMRLLLPLCTTLALVDIFLLAHLCHNAPLLSFLILLLGFFSTLATLLVVLLCCEAWNIFRSKIKQILWLHTPKTGLR